MNDNKDSIVVTCSDQRYVITCRIGRLLEGGCELESSVGSADPLFALDSRVLLNLLNENNGSSVSIIGKLKRIRRENGVWKYRVAWKQKPEILEIAA